MGSNLEVKKLGDVINLKRGYDLPASKRINGEVPIMASSGVTGYHNEAKVQGPGVITGRSGQLGKVFYVEENYWALNTTLYVENFKGNYPKFIYYLLQTLNFEQFNAGSSVPTLNRNHVHQLEVRIPSLGQQQKIGDSLYKFEEKVIVNKKLIDKLEEIVQTLFKRWFIDFEFPNEQGLPYRSSGGEMVESELGKIPLNWKIGNVGSVSTKIYAGGTPSRKKEAYWEKGEIPWLKTKEIKNNIIINADENISLVGLENSSAKWIPSHSVVVAMYGNTAAQLGYIAKEMTSNQACCAVVGPYPNFIFNYLKLNQQQLKDLATGSAQQNLNKDIISNFKLIISDMKLITAYEEVTSTLRKQMITLTEENMVLEQLRDNLLPKLLSGEIEIPDESVVES